MRAEQIKQLSPHLSDEAAAAITAAIIPAMTRFGIQTPRQVRYFIAQTCFESQGFTRFAENLNYTHAEQLVKVWPHRFTLNKEDTKKAYAPDYIRNPQALANLVYANRNGNGPPESGDGYDFRGQGPIELTGRANFYEASMAIYGDDRLVYNPELVQQPEVGFAVSAWFWQTRGLNELAENDEFTRVTEVVNGSDDTVPQRLEVLAQVNDIF